MADALKPQDGLYTLITRSREGDNFELIGALSAVHGATEHETYLDYLSRAELAIITITVTEAGYLRGADGHLDAGRDVIVSDLEALRSDPGNPAPRCRPDWWRGWSLGAPRGAAALTILSCDNLPENGAVTKTVVQDFAARLDDEMLADWIDSHVDFATSMVDRITPATTDEDWALVQHVCGYVDAYPIPTGPFSEWVVSGGFRPVGQAGKKQVPPWSLRLYRSSNASSGS
jgi:fructuronate reductase